MSLDLTGLANYTDEQKMPLIRQALLSGKTMSMITVQPDIKSSATINMLESDVAFQAGACGWNADGTTALTQRLITVAKFKQNEAICVDDLESKYTQMMMKSGSYNEEIPFEQLYSEEKAARSAKQIEKIVWQGDTASGDANLAIVDGLLKIIDAEGAVITGTTKLLDAANIVDAIDEMVAAVPEDAIESDNLTLFIGYEKFRLYIAALKKANLYHVDPLENNFETTIYGTNVKMVAVGGLNNTGVAGAGRIVLAETSNIYAGTDLLNDAEDFRIFYAQEADEVRFKQKFKLGFQVAFPARIVTN